MPTFSDYAIQHPEPEELDPRMIRPAASVRYTTESDFMIVKGRSVRKYGGDQYRRLCAELCKQKEYRGQGFSWGDAYITDCMKKKTEGCGSGMTWRKVGTNHHLTLAVEQLANLPGL